MVHLGTLLLLALAVSLDGLGVGVTYGLRKIRIPLLSVVIIACCSGVVIGLSMAAGAVLSGVLQPVAANAIGAVLLIGIGGYAIAQFWRSRARQESRGATERSGEMEAGLGPDANEAEALAASGRPDSPYTASGTPADAGAARLAVEGADGAARREGEEQGDGAATATGQVAAPRQMLRLELKRIGLVIEILRTPQAADMDRSGTISAAEAVLLGCALSLDAFGAGLGAALLGLSPFGTALLITVASATFLLLGLQIGRRLSASRAMRGLTLVPGLILVAMGISRLLT
ncbi:manganese efflux pump [Paenibacillus sabuli]|uniref:manganese efflux pump n=1 Tax=Paenibacillus sabuli TaxID=2772509 RepID=UPI00295B6D4F|nr:manganese efflux pump [Paenibacillus sabuli]